MNTRTYLNWGALSFLFFVLKTGTHAVIVKGGNDATKDAYPFAAIIYNDWEFVCGGTLVNLRTVITARHCVEDFGAEYINVVLGEYDRFEEEPSEQVMSVQEMIHHPHGDVSILILTTSASPSASVRPISGFATNVTRTDGYPVTAMGWGLMRHNGEDATAIRLQELTLPLRPLEHCTEDGLTVTEYHLCAGYMNGDYVNVCHADSGGPLVIRDTPDSPWKLIGVIESGHKDCPQKKHHAKYFSIPKIRPWLQEQGVTEVGGDLEMETTTEPSFLGRFRNLHSTFHG